MSLVSHAFRSLRAHPVFSASLIVLLALGIGANTAIFGVVHAVLLQPLPYPDPGHLVVVRKLAKEGAPTPPGGGDFMPDNEFSAWQETPPSSVLQLAAYRSGTVTWQRPEGAIRATSASVTGAFFQMLGLTAWRGRLWQPTDFKAGATPVAILSHALWSSRFNRDDGVLGQIVTLDDVAYTVIGVLPPSFEFVDPVQIWRPLVLTTAGQPGQLRIQMVRAFARLRPEVDASVAQQELDRLSQAFWGTLSSSLGAPRPGGPGPGPAPTLAPPPASAPTDTRGGAVIAGVGPSRPPPLRLPFADSATLLLPLQEQLARQARTTLWILLGAVGFVLLIVCANVASLQLARATGRRRDAALRAALGASPGRLAAELLAENLLLALLGGALGLLLAWWGTQALQVWLAGVLPRINPVGLNGPVLAFAFGIATVAGLGFGCGPAWRGSRVDLLDTLRDGGVNVAGGSSRWRHGLVALEMALALVLAVNTGLLLRSLLTLYRQPLGFRTEDVMTAHLALPRPYATAAQQRDFASRWVAALRGLPGVSSVALADAPPLSQYSQIAVTVTSGSSTSATGTAGRPPPTMAVASVSADFFTTAGIPLRSGRWFSDADGPDQPAVALVNEAFVKEYYPEGLPTGAQINIPASPQAGPSHGAPATATVVGVVGDIRARNLETAPQASAYFPFLQQPRPRLSAVIRFTGDAASLSQAITTTTHKLDANLALDAPTTLAEQLSRQTAPRRVTLVLTGAFAGAAILLAILGLIAVSTYTVAQRTREIGVRLALGAQQRTVVGLILRSAAGSLLLGLVVGVGLTFATSRLMHAWLTGVTTLEPAVVVGAALGLALLGLLACAVPAFRVTRINPVTALREMT